MAYYATPAKTPGPGTWNNYVSSTRIAGQLVK